MPAGMTLTPLFQVLLKVIFQSKKMWLRVASGRAFSPPNTPHFIFCQYYIFVFGRPEFSLLLFFFLFLLYEQRNYSR